MFTTVIFVVEDYIVVIVVLYNKNHSRKHSCCSETYKKIKYTSTDTHNLDLDLFFDQCNL